MSIDVRDLRSTVIPKSDQLNADQLVSGPIIITITDVQVTTSKEQPVTIHYEGEGGRPYKPGLTMRRVLILAWGHDATQWAGRSMELFHEPSVKFGGELVGGIRIARMSHLPKGIKVSLSYSKGKKSLHEINVLRQSDELAKALSAIASAKGKADMAKARALAEALTNPNELDSAKAAYALKVTALKEAAAKPADTATPIGFDLEALKTRAAACKDEAELQVLDDEVGAMAEGPHKEAATAVVADRDRELAGDA